MSDKNLYVLLSSQDQPLIENFIRFYDGAAKFVVWNDLTEKDFRRIEKMEAPVSFIDCHPGMRNRDANKYRNTDLVSILITPRLASMGGEVPTDFTYQYSHQDVGYYETIARYLLLDLVEENEEASVLAMGRLIDFSLKHSKDSAEIARLLSD